MNTKVARKRPVKFKPASQTGVYFNTSIKCFCVGRSRLIGVHPTLERWFGSSQMRTIQGAGSWIDKFNFSRGKSVARDLAIWMRRGGGSHADRVRDLGAPTRAIAHACALRGWRPVAVEFPVGCVAARIGTAVDLIVAAAPPAGASRTWRATKEDPLLLIEVKVIGRQTWKTPNGTTLRVGEKVNVPATAQHAAALQLMLTYLLYRKVRREQKVQGLRTAHVYANASGGTMQCEFEALPSWVTEHAAPWMAAKLKEQV